MKKSILYSLLFVGVLFLPMIALGQEPVIDSVIIDERLGKLIVYGKLGSLQGTVIIDGLNLNILEWSHDSCKAVIPENGKGSAGELQVSTSDGTDSSHTISSWYFQVFENYQEAGSYFSEQWSYNYHLHIRVDIATLNASNYLSNKLIPTVKDSKVEYYYDVARYNTPDGTNHSDYGSGVLDWADDDSNYSSGFSPKFSFDVKQKTIRFSLGKAIGGTIKRDYSSGNLTDKTLPHAFSYSTGVFPSRIRLNNELEIVDSLFPAPFYNWHAGWKQDSSSFLPQLSINKNRATSMNDFAISPCPSQRDKALTFSFSIPTDGYCSISIIDLQGRKQEILPKTMLRNGKHSYLFNLNHITGVYKCELVCSGLTSYQKIILVN